MVFSRLTINLQDSSHDDIKMQTHKSWNNGESKNRPLQIWSIFNSYRIKPVEKECFLSAYGVGTIRYPYARKST